MKAYIYHTSLNVVCLDGLSGAGDYIDGILRDMEEFIVKEDGSSELGRLKFS
jgi:hypothetical protein